VDGDHNPPAGNNQPTEYLMLSATNINQNKIVELDKVRYVTKEIFEVENQRTNVEINDIFFTIVGSMGRSCVYKGGLNICFQRSVSVLRTLVYPEYLKYMLDTPYIQDFMYRNATGTAQKGFYLKQVENLIVALPPLEEQHRIVAKIDELLQYVARYAEYYEKLEHFNAKFPEDMKKSILQYAIQGKLVEQRPEEGTAEELYKQIQEEKKRLINEGKIKKDKPLAEIIDDEIPFDIPESWKWVKLGDCTTYAQTKEKISPSEITSEMWSLDLEDIQKETGNILVRTMASERKITGEKVKFHKNQVLYSKLRPYLKKILVAPDDGICTPELVPFNTYLIDEEYLVNVLKSPHVDNVINAVTYGVKMPRVGTDTMINLLIPLPPLNEQKRIVERIKALLPYCEQLIK
jgi:type I restriction enzyme S subunit